MMLDFIPELAYLAGHVNGFVYGDSTPAGDTTVIQTQLEVRVPVGGADPSAEVMRSTGNAVALASRLPGEQRSDLICEFERNALVGVER
jgi:hypothetical protein